MTEDERTELLVRLDEDIKWIKQQLSNHLHSHFQYSIMAWTTATGAIIALIVALFKN